MTVYEASQAAGPTPPVEWLAASMDTRDDMAHLFDAASDFVHTGRTPDGSIEQTLGLLDQDTGAQWLIYRRGQQVDQLAVDRIEEFVPTDGDPVLRAAYHFGEKGLTRCAIPRQLLAKVASPITEAELVEHMAAAELSDMTRLEAIMLLAGHIAITAADLATFEARWAWKPMSPTRQDKLLARLHLAMPFIIIEEEMTVSEEITDAAIRNGLGLNT